MSSYNVVKMIVDQYGVLDQQTGCINGRTKPKSHGYCEAWFLGKKVRLHRLVFAAANGGAIPDGLLVRHTCDNRKCLNPDHLIGGTHDDNMADMRDRGRSNKGRPLPQNRGDLNRMAKLDESAVLAIRARVASGETRTAVAADYGLSIRHVGSIAARKCWTHV